MWWTPTNMSSPIFNLSLPSQKKTNKERDLAKVTFFLNVALLYAIRPQECLSDSCQLHLLLGHYQNFRPISSKKRDFPPKVTQETGKPHAVC